LIGILFAGVRRLVVWGLGELESLITLYWVSGVDGC